MEKQNSPSKPQRVLVEQESGSSVLISTPAWLSLAKKAGKNEVPLSVLEQVYARGLLESKPHPKNSPEQQAFNRVDSFLHEGKAFEMDQDLVVETPKVPDGRKHMGIIKAAIKRYETKDEPQIDDSQTIKEWHADPTGLAIGRAIGGLLSGSSKRRKKQTPEEIAKGRIEKIETERKVKDILSKQGYAPTSHVPTQKKYRTRVVKAAAAQQAEKQKVKKQSQELLAKQHAAEREARSQEQGRKIEYVTKKVGISHSQYMGKPDRARGETSLSRRQISKITKAEKEYNKKRKTGGGGTGIG